MRPLLGALDLETMSWREIQARLAEEDVGPLAQWLGFLCCPTSINHYWRRYYVAADGLVRLTVDTALAVYAQHLSLRPNLHRAEPRRAALVVEAKADAAQWQRLQSVVAGLPLRPSAFSKYASGVLGDRVLL